MKAFIVLAVMVAAASAADPEYCYQDAKKVCTENAAKTKNPALANCNARYGGIEAVISDLQAYANAHISRSFEYLLMSTHFANYKMNREGFEKFFRGLSDSKWEEGIELMKYLSKRGAGMNFNTRKDDGKDAAYELNELESMAKALDMEKGLAAEAMNIHNEATRKRKEYHDPEVASYLEEEFMHKQADAIRKIAGYTTDLSALLEGDDASLALYMFDEHLKN